VFDLLMVAVAAIWNVVFLSNTHHVFLSG